MDFDRETRIGSGSWSSCYLQDNGTVIIESGDFVKKLMSKDEWPKHRMWPNLKCIAVETEDDEPLYQMEELKIISKISEEELIATLSKRQYRFFKLLEKINFINGSIESQKKRLSKWFPKEFRPELKQIFRAFDYMESLNCRANFECQPFNLAVKGDKVIMLDCFFPSGNKSLEQFSNPEVHEIELD